MLSQVYDYLLNRDHIVLGFEIELNLGRSLKTFPGKGQIVSIFSLVGHMVSVATVQVCHYRVKAVWYIEF